MVLRLAHKVTRETENNIPHFARYLIICIESSSFCVCAGGGEEEGGGMEGTISASVLRGSRPNNFLLFAVFVQTGVPRRWC